MSRIAIKLGELEVEYEGDQKFIEGGGLLKLVKEIATSLEAAPATGDGAKRKPKQSAATLSTSSIAQRIGGKSGPNLAIAAAAHLTLVKQKEKFTYTELLEEMRQAKTLYKSTYHKNLGNTLKSLVGSDRLNHIGGDDYALTEAELIKVEAALA